MKVGGRTYGFGALLVAVAIVGAVVLLIAQPNNLVNWTLGDVIVGFVGVLVP